jgi:hypothetical protein
MSASTSLISAPTAAARSSASASRGATVVQREHEQDHHDELCVAREASLAGQRPVKRRVGRVPVLRWQRS